MADKYQSVHTLEAHNVLVSKCRYTCNMVFILRLCSLTDYLLLMQGPKDWCGIHKAYYLVLQGYIHAQTCRWKMRKMFSVTNLRMMLKFKHTVHASVAKSKKL